MRSLLSPQYVENVTKRNKSALNFAQCSYKLNFMPSSEQHEQINDEARFGLKESLYVPR